MLTFELRHRTFQRMQSEPLPIKVLVHASNAEMILRLAETLASRSRQTKSGDWLEVTYRYQL